MGIREVSSTVRDFSSLARGLQNPVLKWSIPRTMLPELRRRIAAAIYGWDCPFLTFIYPGFDCGSAENGRKGGKQEPPNECPSGARKCETWPNEQNELACFK